MLDTWLTPGCYLVVTWLTPGCYLVDTWLDIWLTPGLTPGCHQIATKLPPSCHQVATKLPPSCHHTQSTPDWTPGWHLVDSGSQLVATWLPPGSHLVDTWLTRGSVQVSVKCQCQPRDSVQVSGKWQCANVSWRAVYKWQCSGGRGAVYRYQPGVSVSQGTIYKCQPSGSVQVSAKELSARYGSAGLKPRWHQGIELG
jgi:hypothetical protein